MFVCDKCMGKHYENGPSLFRSEGPCEICGKTHICSDIKSGVLIPKVSAHIKALAEQEAMKELGEEITDIIERVTTLNMSELCFLEDGIVDRMIKLTKTQEKGIFVMESEDRVLKHFTDFIGAVKVHINMIHDGNVNAQSTAKP